MSESQHAEPKVSPEALRLFAGLASELEVGRGDPERFFETHSALADELRTLYRGWLELDALLRDLTNAGSLVRYALDALDGELTGERTREVLGRIPRGSDFATRYELGEELARGGMGIVRRVRDRVLGRDLAMKVIRPVEPGQRTRLLRRFLEEAEVIGRFEHPGIVPIHELGLDAEAQVYFTMPLVRGRTLEEVLELVRGAREGWTRARVLEVLLKVCDALAYAHSRGVLHRDLKPANVMVGRFGEVYVMDWGLARALGSIEVRNPSPATAAEPAPLADGPLTLAGEVLGTPAYMAPEQALGRSGELDQRCDVYALGAILYELLSGFRPYSSRTSQRTSQDTLVALCAGPPPDPGELARDVPGELVAICRRAMARTREARYATVQALADDLRAYLEDRVVVAHERGAWAEARKWVRRNRRFSAALMLAAMALVIGLVTSLILLRRAETERANVLRLSAGKRLANLEVEAESLWPPHPERIPAMEAWLEQGRKLVRQLDPEPISGDTGLLAQLTELEARKEAWSEDDSWWHEQLAALVTDLRAFADPATGLMGSGLAPERGWGVARRMALARELGTRTLEGAEARARWAEARTAIASSAHYGGLMVSPQVGLLPLGPDPASGLWEFADLASGPAPARASDGRLALEDASAILLVLVPGGEFLMGSQGDDPAAANYISNVDLSEWPAHACSIAPFFLSKYEMTQEQWRRATGASPSYYQEGRGAALLPLENVNWFMAQSALARLGLRLPAEAEWEYACRAGTTSEFFWGSDPLASGRFANVKDIDNVKGLDGWQSPEEHVPMHDGFELLAPVGSFQANPWGFHDLLGNVVEWCADEFASYPGNAGSPREYHYPKQISMRIMRGGGYHRRLDRAHCAARDAEIPDFAYRALGVRPARDFMP